MKASPGVERITIDLRANTLILDLNRSLDRIGPATATIDIGALGRLIGVEIDDRYLGIADPVPGSESLGRSVTVEVQLRGERRVVVPRRGPGWEISFPSGNQCWKRTTSTGAEQLCSVIG